MAVFDDPPRGHEVLRWFVGVPVGTNPLFLLDFASALMLAWVLCWGALLGLQWIFSGAISGANVADAARIASFISLVFVAIFVVVCFGILRNRYAALFRFDDVEAYCESIRCNPKALKWALVRFRPYPIEPLPEAIRSVERRVLWREVRRLVALEDVGILLLKGRRGTLLRIYCPDGETYRQALKFASSRIDKS